MRRSLHELFCGKSAYSYDRRSCAAGGFGSAVLEYAHDHGFHHTEIDRMGIPDKFIEHGSVNELLEEIGMTVDDVVERMGILARKKQKRA